MKVDGKPPPGSQWRPTTPLEVHGEGKGAKGKTTEKKKKPKVQRQRAGATPAWGAGSRKRTVDGGMEEAPELPRRPTEGPVFRPMVHASRGAMKHSFTSERDKPYQSDRNTLEDAEDDVRSSLAELRRLHEPPERTLLRILSPGLESEQEEGESWQSGLGQEGSSLGLNTARPQSKAERASHLLSQSKRRYHPESTGNGFAPTTDSQLRFRAPVSEEGDIGRAAWLDEMVERMKGSGAAEDVEAEGKRLTLGKANLAKCLQEAGIELGQNELEALCTHYASKLSSERVDVKRFVRAMVATPGKSLASEGSINGPLRAEAGAKEAENKRILYYPSRKGVVAPSDFTDEQLQRSVEQPAASLQMEHAFGATSFAKGSPGSLRFLASGKIAFPAGNLVVQMEPEDGGRQLFCKGHNDEVTAVSASEDGQLIASGQVGKQPSVKVFDADSRRIRQKFLCDEDDRWVACLGISPWNRYVAAVVSDNKHSVIIFDCRRSRRVFRCASYNGRPPLVHGLRWSPSGESFLTFGAWHLKLWQKSNEGFMPPQSAIFGEFGKRHVLCAEFLPADKSGDLLFCTGHEGGQILIWSGLTPLTSSGSHDGCSISQLCRRGSTLFSAGHDGRVRVWSISDVSLTRIPSQCSAIPEKRRSGKPVRICALDVDAQGKTAAVATRDADIWLAHIGDSERPPSPLLRGHFGNVYELAWYPEDPDIFVTSAEDGRAVLYSSSRRIAVGFALLGSPKKPGKARAADFSPNGKFLAFGMADGSVQVFRIHRHQPESPLDTEIKLEHHKHVKPAQSAIADLSYSPRGTMLAVASHDCVVDVLRAARGHQLVCRCPGHSATVLTVDWSEDGHYIRARSRADEVLHYEATTGRLVNASLRDEKWARWTSTLGFQVMGIWREGVDPSDIDACHADSSRSLLAVADDYGGVSLYNFPCVAQGAGRREYTAHASHVASVRFNTAGDKLASAGSNDKCVLLWRVNRAGEEEEEGEGEPASWRDEVGEGKGSQRKERRKGKGGISKERMAEMEREVEAMVRRRRKREERKGRPVSPPEGKVWGEVEPGRGVYGWVDASHESSP